MSLHGAPIRDADMNVVDRLGSAPLLNAIKRPGLERIDIWPAGRRKAMVGFVWADGASAICDVPWNPEAIQAWAVGNGVGRMARIHMGLKKES